jgi:hypothetical protein
MPVSCVFVTINSAAAASTVPAQFFLDRIPEGGHTYFRNCDGTTYINVTLGNAISAANGGDPVN